MKAHLAGLGFASIFGVSFIFSKLALSLLTPFGLLSLRFIIAFGVMNALVSLKIIQIKINPSMLRFALPVVIAQPILYFTFENIGLSMVPSSLAGIMIALIPLVTLFMASIRLQQPLNVKQLLWMLLSFSGVIALTLLNASEDPTASSLLGLLLMFGAVISAAVFNILSKEASNHMDALSLTYMMMGVGALGFTLLHGIEVITQSQPWNLELLIKHPQLSYSLLYLGIVASIGGFFLINYALGKLMSATVSVYSNLATVVSIIVGVVLLSEPFSLWHALSAVAVILGVRGSVLSVKS
jgi:drug/metabolite transporter (DMT)-like permease